MIIDSFYMKFILPILICFTFILAGEEYLPELGSNNFGNKFLISLPPNLQPVENSKPPKIKFILFSPVDGEVNFKIPNKGFKINVKLESYKPKSVLIDASIAQPITANGYQNINDNMVIQNAAIQIDSHIMFSVVVVSDFPESADAFLAMPISAMGKKYVVSSWADNSEINSFTHLPSATVITSTEDNNIVTIRYSSIVSNEYSKRRTFSYQKKLNKGDVWYLSSEIDHEDISGSVVTSTKPVSVVSGNQCASIPEGNGNCDFIVGQEIPTDYWGKSYLISGNLNRKMNPIVRVFTYSDSTIIYKNDIAIDTLIFQDKFNSFSSYIDLARSSNQENYFVSGNKPILCVLYSTGAEEDFEYKPEGNPSLTHLQPIDNLQKDLYITNPDAGFDISFPRENFLTIIYQLDEDLSLDELEIGEVLNGSTKWAKVQEFKGLISAESITSQLVRFAIIKIDLGMPGNFRIRGKNGLSATLYGNNEIKSYGYPANYPTKISNQIDSIPPQISWRSECDLVRVNVYDEKQMDIVHLVEDNINFEVLENNRLSENNIELILKVVDPSIEASIEVTFFDKSRNRATEQIFYSPNSIKFDPKKIDYGKIRRGELFVESLTITNNTDSIFTFDMVDVNSLPVEISLKNSNDNITGELQINPGSTVYLDVKFISYRDSVYKGFISFFNECLGELKVEIEADVSSPVIYVSDIPFQFLTNGDNVSNTFTCVIENTGPNDLVVNDHTIINGLDIQSHSLPEINETDPLIISPNNDYRFTVAINTLKLGKVSSQIIFNSNASGIDSICEITGTLVTQGIITRGTNFGRKKVSVSSYQFGPYTADNKPLIENSSPLPIHIEQIRINENLNGESFLFNGVPLTFYDDLLNTFLGEQKFIDAEQQIELDIEFLPQNLDSAYLEIEVLVENSNNYSPAVFRLEGFGTRPKLELEIEQAEKYFTGSEISSNGKIIIRNLSQSEWEYADDIEYLEFKVDITNPYAEYYNLESKTISISKGEEYIIPFAFEPGQEISSGEYSLDIAIYSEALMSNNIYSLITEVTNQEISYSIMDRKQQLKACQGEKDNLSLIVENNGDELVVFEPLKLEPPLPQFIFKNFDFATTEFSINPGEKDTIEIEFLSTGDDRETNLIIKPKKQLLADSILIKGKNFYIEPLARIIPEDIEVKVNQEKINKIKLYEFNNENLESVKKLNVSLIYDKKYLQIDLNKIKLADNLLADYLIDNKNFNPDLGLINFDIVALDSFEFTNDMDLLDFSIFGLLPQDLINTTKIETKIEVPENTCINFISDESGNVEILTECDQDLRKVNIFGEYYIQDNLPNPINNKINIEFGIAIAAQTIIEVYNSNGELTLILKDEFLEPGSYTFNLPADILPNGIYFIRISSGTWNTIHQFVVSK